MVASGAVKDDDDETKLMVYCASYSVLQYMRVFMEREIIHPMEALAVAQRTLYDYLTKWREQTAQEACETVVGGAFVQLAISLLLDNKSIEMDVPTLCEITACHLNKMGSCTKGFSPEDCGSRAIITGLCQDKQACSWRVGKNCSRPAGAMDRKGRKPLEKKA